MPVKKEPEKRYEHVAIPKILVDQKYQFRANLSSEVAEDYALAISNNAKFPNLIVFDTGREDGLYTLVDGFQRLTAYQVNDYRKVHVDVIEGTEEQALLYALNANAANGARYTNADKRKRAIFCFGHKTMSKWSDNKIADYLGVTQGFISGKRREYEETRGIDESEKIIQVETKDGRSYQMDTKKGVSDKGNKQGLRKKVVIPEEQKVTLVLDEDIEPTQLVLGDTEENRTQLEDNFSKASNINPGTYTSKDGLMKVTLGELSDILSLREYDLIIYSSSIEWLTDNQEIITSNPNVIVQGSTGNDVNKLQSVDTLANTFNLFLIEGRMTVAAYYCSKSVEISDKVIATYNLYLSELIQCYIGSSGSILLVDPLNTTCEVMQQLGHNFHTFYSEKNLNRFQKELSECEILGIEFEDNSDIN